jgi:subtilisin family serine protease
MTTWRLSTFRNARQTASSRPKAFFSNELEPHSTAVSYGGGGCIRVLAILPIVLCLVPLAGCSTRQLDPKDLQTDSWAMVAVSGPGRNEEPQLVALIDGGIERTSDVAANVVDYWEPHSLRGLPRGPHATEVAGLIAGEGTSVDGTVELLDIRVLDESGQGTPEDIAAGIRWAISANADILSLSLVIQNDHQSVRSAIAEAHDAGVIVVASASNNLLEAPSYPAEYPHVIGVTGMDSRLERAPLARARGALVVAPSHEVQTTSADGDVVQVSGTSMATAISTGIIAKCLDASWGPSQILSYAETSSVKVTFDDRSIPLLRCPPKGNR